MASHLSTCIDSVPHFSIPTGTDSCPTRTSQPYVLPPPMSNSAAHDTSDTNRIPVTVQLDPDQIEWLESVADRRNVNIAAIIRHLLSVCRNAAMSARRRHTASPTPASASDDPSSKESSDESSALDRLRRARSDVQRLAEEGPTGAAPSRPAGREKADRSEESSETSERPPSFFERVTSEAMDLTDSPASGDA